ncbi:MAG: NAD(P)-dependent oxidoreductase [Tissierellia bacterium]|nr:NAD(P)-dependent oxidoreductase [Tissierellia bacterium]
MKIKLIEPLGINDELLNNYRKELENLGHEFEYYGDKAKDIDEQKKRVEGADILMIANSPLPKEAFENQKDLKLINVAFTGFDHVAMEQANKMGIKVCNASGYSNVAVAELVIGLVLDIYRMISKGDEATRGSKTHADYYTGYEIRGKTVGIIGTGNIGIETAKLFKAFGADVIAFSRTERDDVKKMGIKYKSIEEVFKNSDIISVHLPLNENTKGFITGDLLELMKPSAIFINCARGPIVDNTALSDVLNNEKIKFAGIDVFDIEPPLNQDYPLLNCKNILLSPHIAYLTKESMVRRAKIAFDNTINFLNGNPTNIVN